MDEHMFVARRRYTRAEFDHVLRELDRGLSAYRVANDMGIPWSTVKYWRRHPVPHRHRWVPENWRPPAPDAYCHLLGLYLGDGCLTRRGPAAVQLQLTLDERYPGIIEEAEQAVARTIPGIHVGRRGNPGAVCVYASHPALLAAFPQHGPGRKHQRKIELADWQLVLTREYPREFIRGLIHSDGSRCINRFKTKLPGGRIGEYEYVRYFFTNYSADIRQIFCDHCDLLGIRWTQSSFKNISVAHRDSVAVLDSFVGPKR